MNKAIGLLVLLLMTWGYADAQRVKLTRLERAAGADSVLISNASGVPEWKDKSGLFGSGTDGEVAVWSNDTLTSTGWGMTSAILQGGTTGDPSINLTENGYLFNGDNSGLKRYGTGEIGLLGGTLARPMFYLTASGNTAYFDLDENGSPEWYLTTSELYNFSAANAPLINTTSYTFRFDTDSGIKRGGADIIGIHAGDGTNPVVEVDGASDQVIIDADDDGTPEGTWSGSELELDATLKIGTWYSSPNSVRLYGVNTSQGNNLVVVGDGLSLSNDTLSISDALSTYLFCGNDNIATSQTISLSGTTSYDTIGWTTTFQEEGGITYGPPNPGQDSSIIFTYGGRYEITISFTAEFAAGASNKFVYLKLNKNGTTGVTGGSHTFGFEDTNKHAFAVTLQVDVADDDYLQILMRSNHGSSANITFNTPKISVKPMQ